jgi:phosphoesterase RecJ-like protein
MTAITEQDYRATGASEAMTEGIIDHLRSVDGGLVAAVVRDLGSRGRAARKVSLRATAGEVDVSAIARSQGGGGHVRAAGFSTDLAKDEIIELLCAGVRAQLD